MGSQRRAPAARSSKLSRDQCEAECAAREAEPSSGVIGFYGHRPGTQFCEFSNFFLHNRPFEFVLPIYARRAGFPTSVWCHFSEKAIMATKAALMGDLEVFGYIDKADDPRSCKALGRGVRNFDEALWQRHLDQTAFEVVRQKFESDRRLRDLLLSTGNKTLAEAAPNDCIWGIGLPRSDPQVQNPALWRGRNILGTALMRTRDHLRGHSSAASDLSVIPAKEQQGTTAASSVPVAKPSAAAVGEGEDEGPASELLSAGSAPGKELPEGVACEDEEHEIGEQANAVTVRIISFGFMCGEAPQADVELSARHIRKWGSRATTHLSGLDAGLRKEVMQCVPAKLLLQKALDDTLKRLEACSGEKAVSIAVGCDHGKHGSVIICVELEQALRSRRTSQGRRIQVQLVHREESTWANESSSTVKRAPGQTRAGCPVGRRKVAIAAGEGRLP